MPSRDLMRSITSMRVMAELASDSGTPLKACLAGTGVSERSLVDSSVLVTASQELRLIRNIIEHLDDRPCLGLEAGRRYHFTSFGMLGLAMVSSRNMHSAFDIAMRYFDLTFAFTRFRLADRNGETHVTLDDSAIPADLRRFIVERDASAMMTIQRELFSLQAPLKRLSFRFCRPAQVLEYERIFGVPPIFSAPFHVAVFDQHLLQLPLPQANEFAYRTAEEQCRRLLNERSAQASIVTQVRECLAMSAEGAPDMETIAIQLCMTTRTLRRRLHAENTSFIALRDEFLHASAKEWLSVPSISVEQIGERLGYADPTCFINAFKRWTGKTPYSYRLMMREERLRGQAQPEDDQSHLG